MFAFDWFIYSTRVLHLTQECFPHMTAARTPVGGNQAGPEGKYTNQLQSFPCAIREEVSIGLT